MLFSFDKNNKIKRQIEWNEWREGKANKVSLLNFGILCTMHYAYRYVFSVCKMRVKMHTGGMIVNKTINIYNVYINAE